MAQSFTSDYKPPKRLQHLHGSGASSLKPHIYEAVTELGDKIKIRLRLAQCCLDYNQFSHVADWKNKSPENTTFRCTNSAASVVFCARVL